MNQLSPSEELTTKVLAVLGSVALGFTAMINAVIAAVALFTGNLSGALGDALAKHDDALASSANQAASTAKAVAIAFAVLAALEFGAGEFLRRRVRNMIVPIACAATAGGEIAFSVWIGKFTALDAMLIACALFAAWTWWRLPRPELVRELGYGQFHV
jgi:hypothetical protein